MLGSSPIGCSLCPGIPTKTEKWEAVDLFATASHLFSDCDTLYRNLIEVLGMFIISTELKGREVYPCRLNARHEIMNILLGRGF